MVRQTGGKKWKQGADGCIFDPSVECKGATTQNPVGTISKVVPKGTVDEITEAYISSRFPAVVKGKGVLIASQRCTPVFSALNLTENANIKSANSDTPCKQIDESKADQYTNFVIEKYGPTFLAAANPPATWPFRAAPLPLGKSLKLLRRALNAAVALVPDGGPWVIGLDFHIGNILVKEGSEPFSSLADWGRTLIIENPNDLNSIRGGLLTVAEVFIDLGLMHEPPRPIPAGRGLTKKNYISFANFGEGRSADYAQFGIKIRDAMDNILHNLPTVSLTSSLSRIAIPSTLPQVSLADRIENYQKDISKIRVNSIYGILRSAKYNSSIGTLPDLDILLEALLNCTSQQQIIDILNMYIRVDGIRNYIDLATLFPPVTRGGVRRKQNKTLKKRGRHRR